MAKSARAPLALAHLLRSALAWKAIDPAVLALTGKGRIAVKLADPLPRQSRQGLAAFAIGLSVCGAVAAADKPWIEVKSQHFTVLSNAGDKQARRIAWQLEQVRATFQALWPSAKLQSGKPFVAFAVKDEATMKQLVPEYWERKGGIRPAGMFVSGSDRHYIATRVDISEPDQARVNPYYGVYQGYVTKLLDATAGFRMPLWLYRGMMQLLGNTVVQSNEVLIGALIPWHFETLRQRSRLPLRTLFAVDRRSPEYLDEGRRPVFDAESWALCHYLMFGNNGANAQRFSVFMNMLAERNDLETAMKEAYGGVDAVDKAFSYYLGQQLLT